MRQMKKRAVVWSVLLSMIFQTTAWGMELQNEETVDYEMVTAKEGEAEKNALEPETVISVDETADLEDLEEPSGKSEESSEISSETENEDFRQQITEENNISDNTDEASADEEQAQTQELLQETKEPVSGDTLSWEAQMASVSSDFTIEGTVLKKYTGAGGQVVIPSTVTEIGSYAFQNCTGLQSVTIPGSVTTIGYEAFYGCTGLRTVTLNSGLITIKSQAFRKCTAISSITIPNTPGS